ncbi:uncharacterized protein LOC142340865 isoform X2 [Convolutriloba macropyga]|uniref:uncharacterized protein LOC142340865 isoform X2 n=1 Tax=Convolutriloba macropyga TaxID=536237 RepID=UPI003F51EDCC
MVQISTVSPKLLLETVIAAINDSSTSTGENWDGGDDKSEVYDTTPLVMVTGLNIVAVLSLLLIIIIARGLQGDFAAGTFLWVQAVGQILQQLSIMQLCLCATVGDHLCLRDLSGVWCKATVYLAGCFFLLADWLAVPLTIDRLIAVRFTRWYRNFCSHRNAWLIVTPVIVVVCGMMIPKSITADIVDGSCLSVGRLYDQFISVMALPAIVIVTLGTITVLVFFARRHEIRNTAESKCHYQSNLALVSTCVVYAVSGTLQYSLLFLGFFVKDYENEEQGQFLLGMGYMIGSTGVIVRVPVMLMMEPMRHALVRGVGLKIK